MFAAGEVWRENRKFVLTKFKDSGFNERRKMEEHLSDELIHFFNHFENLRLNNGNIIPMYRAFKLTSLNMLWRTLCGTRFKEEDAEVKLFTDRLDRVLSAIKVGTEPMHAFPFLRKIPGLTVHDELIANFKGLRAFFRVIHYN
jgi:hypothetical protein